MLTHADRTFQLPSGQEIALDESGDPQGTPLFFFHGWPASRLQGAGFGVEARALGFRILAPDRPGVGLSSPQPGRQLLDWPPVVEELARQLGIDRFCVLAVSGGGPYALATAYALPHLVEVASIVSGAPPLAAAADRQSLLPIYRWLLAAYSLSPALLGLAFRLVRPFVSRQPPRWLWPLLLRLAPSADAGALQDPQVLEGSLDCHREAWRGSARGVFADGEVYARDWGFAVEEVQARVHIWHGREDTSFSWQLAETLAARLPRGETRFVEGEGHYSLPIAHKMAILRDLWEARG